MREQKGKYYQQNTQTEYEALVRDIRSGLIKPVYFLMGEESYFIDRIANLLIQTVLTEAERNFNLITLYGSDETKVTAASIINAASSFPMGAQRQVVVVREAQNIKSDELDKLALYIEHPQPSTVLIVCLKADKDKMSKIDRRKKVFVRAAKVGVVFDSAALKEAQLPAFIMSYLSERNLRIDERGAALLTELVGTDLSRLTGELDKLAISLPAGTTTISWQSVQTHIGLSREFNYFELQDALVARDAFKANRIIHAFSLNPTANPLPLTLTMLFRFFTQLLLAYYAPARNDLSSIGQWLGMADWQVRKNILPGMKAFKARKVMNIISEIRRTDARSKGVDAAPGLTDADLLRELVFFILH